MQLIAHPRSGSVVPELGREDIRELFVYSFRLIYRISGDEHVHALRAVGWLTGDKAFPTGATDPNCFAKMNVLLVAPRQPMVFGGVHDCELCQFDPPYGHANLFVPNGSLIFVFPELLVHYVAAHHYRPPDEFWDAVTACPNTRTMQYKKLLLDSGGRNSGAKTGITMPCTRSRRSRGLLMESVFLAAR